MKKLIAVVLLSFLTNTLAFAAVDRSPAIAPAPAKLKFDVAFIFAKVLEKKHLDKKDDIAFPKIYFQSTTPLKQFQDAIEKQWGFRPDQITNAFAIANNEIYILDEADYYKKQGRCMDDSLAHELTHYLQVKYQNWDISDESLEWEAIDIQTAFRHEFCQL